VETLFASGYDPDEYYIRNHKLNKIVFALNAGFNGVSFGHITNYLLSSGYRSDPFMCLADFQSYINAHSLLDEAYRDPLRWNKMSLMNIASAGIFSSDRSINDYATRIWGVQRHS